MQGLRDNAKRGTALVLIAVVLIGAGFAAGALATPSSAGTDTDTSTLQLRQMRELRQQPVNTGPTPTAAPPARP